MSIDLANERRTNHYTFQQRLVRRVFDALIDTKSIEIVDYFADEKYSQISDNIRLKLPDLYYTICILLKPDIMVGQAYVDGHWQVQPEKLYDFLYSIRSHETSRLQKWFLIRNRAHLLRDSWKQRFFPIRSTRAVVEHYNSNTAFMSLILGCSLSYTCAFFDRGDESLDEAQERKWAIAAQRLSIERGHQVLDLGCGWGYPSIPLAERLGCIVTGITLSSVQVDLCNTRRLTSTAKDNLTFVNADYATFEPQRKFDRLISTGMLEHVGKYQYKHFFNRIAYFLHKDGLALVHGIIEEREVTPDAWIDKNIFPGGYIPTISEVAAGAERSTCQLIKIFTHDKTNYFKTLECWKQNLFDNRQDCNAILRDLGLSKDEIGKVMRIWEYFLSSSQIAFSDRYGSCRVAHFLLKRKI